MNPSLETKFFNLSIFFIIYTIVFYSFTSTLKYTLPFVLAMIFALILKYPTNLLMKHLHIKNALASLITTLTFFAIIISLNALLITSIINELFEITKYLQIFFTSDSNFIYDAIADLQHYLIDINIDPSILDSIKTSLTGSLKGLINSLVSFGSSILQLTINILSYIPYLLMVIIFTLLSTYFFTKEISLSSSNKIINLFVKQQENNKKISNLFSQAKKMGESYFLSYCLLIFMSFSFTLIGFCLFRIKYALVLSILCAFLDLLPVVGMPLVYIPLSIIYLSSGNYFTGIGLLILYLFVFITRQITEPKLMSSSLGIHPIAVLASIFIGLQADGFRGMLFLMFLVICYNILKKCDIV